MSKSLRSMGTFERRQAIARRIAQKTGGLGYFAALDAQKHEGEKKNEPVMVEAAKEVTFVTS